jgi:endonuclease YncB( thermonuclease family)
VAIADGDTLTVLNEDFQQVKIRLAEIDAPEKKQAFRHPLQAVAGRALPRESAPRCG